MQFQNNEEGQNEHAFKDSEAGHPSKLRVNEAGHVRADQAARIIAGQKQSVNHAAIEAGDMAAAKSTLVAAETALCKAATKGVLHKNNASRKVSRLSKAVSDMK